MSQPLDLDAIKRFLVEFEEARDWGALHNPKNLVMALVGEVGELVELFQWLTAEEAAEISQDPATKNRVAEEIADVTQYLIRLSDMLDIDLESAIWDKLRLNERRYPAAEFRGSARKYSDVLEERERSGGSAE